MTQDLYFRLLNNSALYIDTVGKVLEDNPKLDQELRHQLFDCLSAVEDLLLDCIALSSYLTKDED